MKHIDDEIQKTLESLNGRKATIAPAFYSRLNNRMEAQSYSLFSFKSITYAFSVVLILSTGIALGNMYNNTIQNQTDELEEFISTYDLATSTSDYIEFE